MIREALRVLIDGGHLTEGLATAAMDRVLAGEASPAEIAALATALRINGETTVEILAAARALRKRCGVVEGLEGVVLDTCGTGGGAASTFNVSTVAAIVVAACGVTVAKHGLRAVTSRTGSADLVEALGVHIDAPRSVVSRCLREVGIGFLYAPTYHVALAHAAVVRQELGFRTVFDLLGPLANPAGATHQLLGVHAPRYVRPMAEALGSLGTHTAWVVHGHGGMDEVSPTGPTAVASVRDGVVTEGVITPADFGLHAVDPDSLAGGDPQTNAAIARAVLAGAHGGPRTAVLLNAAASLVVAGVTTDLAVATHRAQRAIDEGAARNTLDRWIALSATPHDGSPANRTTQPPPRG